MDSFFAGVWLGLRTFVTKPIEYLTNPVEATTSVYKSDLQKEGMPMEMIDQAVKSYEDSGGPITGISKGIAAAVKSVGNIVNFVGKNFTWILILVAVGIAAWYILMFRKATSA